MSIQKYSNIEKLAHRLYLENFALSRATFFLEKTIFRNKIHSSPIDQAVFVTGLARAGTTVVFNALFNTDRFASLKYSNMPFLLMPNIWSKLHKSKTSSFNERAHGDGIMVNNQSPEAFDEYFWKVFLNDNYITDLYLMLHDVSEDLLSEYEHYIKLICHAQHKSRYLSKNNNNVLRLNKLHSLKIPNKIILIFRHPADHAMSLLNTHQLFCTAQKKDPFSVEYFDFLGHHEFGLHHKLFFLNADDLPKMSEMSNQHPDYWLYCWKSYYSYVLEHLSDDMSIISFEDICNHTLRVAEYLNEKLNLNFIPIIPQREKQSVYNFNFNQNLLNACIEIYQRLNDLCRY
ncbi:MAG: hypothetical protein KGP35_09405 [Bacteroidetes bacterium]|nr:hypothetical protein [Bacteroidota bacterium]